jgi:hypothetical protein
VPGARFPVRQPWPYSPERSKSSLSLDACSNTADNRKDMVKNGTMCHGLYHTHMKRALTRRERIEQIATLSDHCMTGHCGQSVGESGLDDMVVLSGNDLSPADRGGLASGDLA